MNSLYLGFDIGCTNTRAAVIDSSGDIKHLIYQKVDNSSPKALFEQVGHMASQLRGLFPQEKIAAAGFGIAGFIDFRTFILDKSPNLRLLDGINLQEQLKNQISIPFFIDNDANVAALAEKIIGWGREVANLVFITIGTGWGSGIILNGKIWHGVCGYAGELGHTTFDPNGIIKCGCDNYGCLETVVSGTGIVHRVKKYLEQGESSSLNSYQFEQITAKLVYDEATKGDALAIRILEETGIALGIAMANIVNVLNIELIVLGGKVMKASDFILPPALKEMEKRALECSFKSVSVKLSQLGEYAGLQGAALLAAKKMGNLK